MTPGCEVAAMFGLFLKFAGVCVLAGIVFLIGALIVTKAIYAWGFLGFFILVAALLLLYGWIYDRRHARAYDDEAEA
jgi:hypothetical protein